MTAAKPVQELVFDLTIPEESATPYYLYRDDSTATAQSVCYEGLFVILNDFFHMPKGLPETIWVQFYKHHANGRIPVIVEHAGALELDYMMCYSHDMTQLRVEKTGDILDEDILDGLLSDYFGKTLYVELWYEL